MPNRPNVLVITTDHWPASLLGVSGHPVIQTPTLDQLANNGRRFTRAYSECPICIPARRSLMTGTSPRTHGDRVYKDKLRMPAVPTLAQTFRNAGYQAYAVGKLHVYPQRDRIGFDDVILDEEGRTQFGVIDDYDLFLGDRGFPGQQFAHGMSNNEYSTRPWHLSDDLHVTNWATQQMARTIKRRDPSRPGFWYLSYRHPHPPLVPLQCYLDMYRDVDPGLPYIGDWAKDFAALPYALQTQVLAYGGNNESFIRTARRAFYALCTHIDHQLRIIIGTLREEKLLNETIILFHSDHGDMLGNHGLWHKIKQYEDSAGIPMILVGTNNNSRVGHHVTDDRLVCLRDIMPTLLDLAGIEIPKSVEGISMLSDQRRDSLYGEWGEDAICSRMIHDGRHKLIYYPCGNRVQLFDLQEDPHELNDLSKSPASAAILGKLTKLLIAQLYGGDEKWVENGKLVGIPNQTAVAYPNRTLNGQRGIHWPPPPRDS
jgi:arylsulfatase A-like enzyme